jgi:uracil-DNA glycosylase
MSDRSLSALLGEIRGCRVCAAHLPLGPRPILRARASARLLIVGQAPGTKVHESGIPWDSRVAIVPMGFCYPGVDAHGGDRPPRRECAPLWHARLLALLPRLELTLLVGSHAQHYYLTDRGARTMTETVRGWRDCAPRFIPLPHPSWRNTAWLRRNPWFETELLPELRRRARNLL